MFNRVMAVACIILSVLICNTAESATVVSIDNGSVTGIQDLSISGNRYDVDFIFDDYVDIWGTGFDFLTETQADTAATAVIEVLNNIGATSVKDVSTSKDYFLIPYTSGNAGNSVKIISSSSEYLTNDWAASVFHESSPPVGNRIYAKFITVSTPIPGAFILFGSSLIGIIGVRRKRNK